MMKRVSVCECAGSGMVIETGSPKTVVSLFKADAVLGQIYSGFVHIPFKSQHDGILLIWRKRNNSFFLHAWLDLCRPNAILFD